jgi:hypothetical protein
MSDSSRESNSLSFCEFVIKRLGSCCRKTREPSLKIEDLDLDLDSKLVKPILLDLNVGELNSEGYNGACATVSTFGVTRLDSELSDTELSFSKRYPGIELSLSNKANPLILKELTDTEKGSIRRELTSDYKQEVVQL